MPHLGSGRTLQDKLIIYVPCQGNPLIKPPGPWEPMVYSTLNRGTISLYLARGIIGLCTLSGEPYVSLLPEFFGSTPVRSGFTLPYRALEDRLLIIKSIEALKLPTVIASPLRSVYFKTLFCYALTGSFMLTRPRGSFLKGSRYPGALFDAASRDLRFAFTSTMSLPTFHSSTLFTTGIASAKGASMVLHITNTCTYLVYKILLDDRSVSKIPTRVELHTG